jgi:NAD(P)H-dependent FMN reductase
MSVSTINANQPQILIFAGSMRADSIHRKLARAAAAALEKAGGKVKLIELRDYPIPIYDGDLEVAEGVPEAANQLRNLIGGCDGFAIASPEYNGSFSPLMKNVIDWVSRPEPRGRHLSVFKGKVAGLLSASPGPGGGRRGLRHMRELLEMIGVSVIARQAAISHASEAFDGEGQLVRESDVQSLREWAEDLVAVANERKRVVA